MGLPRSAEKMSSFCEEIRPGGNPTARWKPRVSVALMVLLVLPSALPSYVPTNVPSSAPPETLFNDESSLPVQQLLAQNVSMTVGGILLPLRVDAQVSFQEITSDYIVRSIIRVLNKENIENLEVKVYLVSTSSRRKLAFMGEKPEGREILYFDALLLIQSAIELHDANRYIAGAFHGNDDRTRFLADLKGTGYIEFIYVESVSVAPVTNVEIVVPESGEIATSNNKNAATIAVPIVVAAAILALLAILGIAIYKRRRPRSTKKIGKRKVDLIEHKSSSNINDLVAVNTTMDMSILEEPARDIIVDTGIDMSSLGDPSLLDSSLLEGMSDAGDFKGYDSEEIFRA